MRTATASALSASWIHPFQRAGFGVAPYRCLGYHLEEYQACPGAPIQCGTSCDYCGTGIKNVYRIESADGVVFKVGCDCVARTGDTALEAAVRGARRAQERADRLREWEERGRPARDAREAARVIQAEVNLDIFAMVLEGLLVVSESQNVGEWERTRAATAYREISEARRGPTGSGGCTDKEWEILALGYPAALLPKSAHISAAGVRLRGIVAQYEGGPVIGIDSQWGASVLNRFRITEGPDAGAILIWKTAYHAAPKGSIVQITGTVKGHSEYKGTAQTLITRCKVEVLETPSWKEEE